MHILVLVCEKVVVVLRETKFTRFVVHFGVFPAVVDQGASFVQCAEFLAAEVLTICSCPVLGRDGVHVKRPLIVAWGTLRRRSNA
jgi:hypothetical protein